MDFSQRYRAFLADGMTDKEARKACQFIEALKAQTVNPVKAFTFDAMTVEQPQEALKALRGSNGTKAPKATHKGLHKAQKAIKGLLGFDPENGVTYEGCTAAQWAKETQRLNEAQDIRDPERFSMIHLAMGFGSNPQNTGRDLDHVLRFETSQDYAGVQDLKKPKRRQKRKKRKSNPKIERI